MPKVPTKAGTITAGGMLREGTPVNDYRSRYGLWVKREDLSCLAPGPPFSKTRGVYARVASRPERIIGVLDTYHSQAGWAVARACQILGKTCINFYPVYKADWGLREPQKRSQSLGANLVGIPAGRSCILFHQARKQTEQAGGYMMPNALKLEESVSETAKEVARTRVDSDLIIIPASSGTIAAGVIRGFENTARYVVHLGYTRSHDATLEYLRSASGIADAHIEIIDEGYAYKDKARDGDSPPWPCNEYYDLKAFRWWLENQQHYIGFSPLFWNIG